MDTNFHIRDLCHLVITLIQDERMVTVEVVAKRHYRSLCSKCSQTLTIKELRHIVHNTSQIFHSV